MVLEIGPHSIEIEGDCMLVRMRGSFTLPHMKAFCEAADRIIAEHGYLFTISDFSAGADFPADSRRYASQWQNTVKVRGSAVFGASFGMTVIMRMFSRATALLHKYDTPLLVAKSENEARAWVDSLRQKPPPPRPSAISRK
jgi:hypothetical protein